MRPRIVEGKLTPLSKTAISSSANSPQRPGKEFFVFEEWFKTIILLWARKDDGKKVLIGDNLSSHMSKEVLTLYQNHNISFILLLENYTDKCQPLDVAFFCATKKGMAIDTQGI